MFSQDQYSLVDFGNGRRLERFGELLLDRSCPSALGFPLDYPKAWKNADARFEEMKTSTYSKKNDNNSLGIRGFWRPLTEKGRFYFSSLQTDEGGDLHKNNSLLKSGLPWQISFENKFYLELKGSPFGHIGVFPEQAENWERIIEFCSKGSESLKRPLRVLNLFGYTGGSALAAAFVGAQTTHLDAARNVVGQAKRNASISFGEANSPHIRWIVDDAVKFVKREIKRNSFYDGIVLDPPSYGHGAKGEVWRLSRDLPILLDLIVQILDKECGFIILSAHTPGFNFKKLETLLKKSINLTSSNVKYFSKVMEIQSTTGRFLYSGDLSIACFNSRFNIK